MPSWATSAIPRTPPRRSLIWRSLSTNNENSPPLNELQVATQARHAQGARRPDFLVRQAGALLLERAAQTVRGRLVPRRALEKLFAYLAGRRRSFQA